MASTLNPYAPPFVPCCYRAVEDFSAEWWQLVKSSPWFRDFWLRERFNEEKLVGLDPDDLQLADAYGSVLHSSDPQQEEEEKKINERVDLMAYESVLHSSDPQQEEEKKINERVDLRAWGADKRMETRCWPSDMRRCSEKAHTFVKSSPWFRDFWLREQFNDEKLVGLDPDELELADAYESVLHSSDPQQKEEKRKKMNERVDLMAWGADKWMEARCRPSDMRRCSEKAHKFVSLRVSPRTIQQPR